MRQIEVLVRPKASAGKTASRDLQVAGLESPLIAMFTPADNGAAFQPGIAGSEVVRFH